MGKYELENEFNRLLSEDKPVNELRELVVAHGLAFHSLDDLLDSLNLSRDDLSNTNYKWIGLLDYPLAGDIKFYSCNNCDLYILGKMRVEHPLRHLAPSTGSDPKYFCKEQLF